VGPAARPSPHREPVDLKRRADRPDIARAVGDRPRSEASATLGPYRWRELGVPMWTSTGWPARSPAVSTARVRPSGVRTVRCMAAPGTSPAVRADSSRTARSADQLVGGARSAGSGERQAQVDLNHRPHPYQTVSVDSVSEALADRRQIGVCAAGRDAPSMTVPAGTLRARASSSGVSGTRGWPPEPPTGRGAGLMDAAGRPRRDHDASSALRGSRQEQRS